jgi:hypothetical protein
MPAYDSAREAFDVVCYLDDAATDHRTVDHAVLGGVVFNRSGFTLFDEHWIDLMHRYGVEQPFHMRELTPHGRLSHVTGCRRWCLLADVMGAINDFKIHTVAISLNNREHERQFSDKLQAAMRVYRLTFMAVALAIHQNAESKNYPKPIAYVLDAGTKHRGQVLDTHRVMQRDRERAGWHLGPISFENDKFSTALQAADVVAWTKRRLDSGTPLPDEFEPLRDLFAENYVTAVVTESLLGDLNERLDPHWSPTCAASRTTLGSRITSFTRRTCQSWPRAA